MKEIAKHWTKAHLASIISDIALVIVNHHVTCLTLLDRCDSKNGFKRVPDLFGLTVFSIQTLNYERDQVWALLVLQKHCILGIDNATTISQNPNSIGSQVIFIREAFLNLVQTIISKHEHVKFWIGEHLIQELKEAQVCYLR